MSFETRDDGVHYLDVDGTDQLVSWLLVMDAGDNVIDVYRAEAYPAAEKAYKRGLASGKVHLVGIATTEQVANIHFPELP